MQYKITDLQIRLLSWIAKKIVKQSHCHEKNIIKYYKIIAEAARNEFIEDTRPGLDAFLIECHQESLFKEVI